MFLLLYILPMMFVSCVIQNTMMSVSRVTDLTFVLYILPMMFVSCAKQNTDVV